jgi:hypothetical protein
MLSVFGLKVPEIFGFENNTGTTETPLTRILIILEAKLA